MCQTFTKVKTKKNLTNLTGSTLCEGWKFSNCTKRQLCKFKWNSYHSLCHSKFHPILETKSVESCLASDHIAVPSYTAYFHSQCTFKTTRYALFGLILHKSA